MSLFTQPDRVVGPTERVVEYVDGELARVLEPGRHRQRRRAVYRPVLVAERLVATAPQEVLTADGVTLRVTAVIRWKVTDAPLFLDVATDPAAVVYLAVQVALRDALIEVDAETAVRQARALLTGRIREAAAAAGATVGIEVVDASVKDVIVPIELRSAYAELVTARTRGQAQLEAARAETAALRSLANGARLLEDHPALARLRLVQALPAGSTVALTTPS